MRYDYSRTFKVTENDTEKEYLYARGILSIEVIGLAKTNTGKLFVPTYKIDENDNMQNFFFKDGKPLPLYTFKNEGQEEILEQPEMEGKTKAKKLYLLCEDKGDTKFFRLEAWEYIAKKMNMFYEKGDEVTIFAQKTMSKGAETGQSEEIWIVNDITKIKKDFITKRGSKKNNENLEKVNEELGLPFN